VSARIHSGEAVAAVPADRIPSGTRDVLPDEMRELRAMTDRIRGVFAAAGYGEVSTPALEYEQTFSRANLPATAPAYRVFDGQGGVLVLRPDMTVPIARLVATRYPREEPPLRFSYTASVWRGVRPQRGQSREVLQAGVELVGAPGAAGTAEVLAVLCAALDAAGLDSYRIGLGDASLYPSLLEAVGVGPDERELILSELAAGDFVGVDREVRALGLSVDNVELLLRLARTRGGPEVLDGLSGALHDAIAPMRELHALLSDKVASRVILDLGLVRSLGYYTGAVFQVYDPAFGMPIGRGGRYDDLLGQFGRPLPAVGFAVNVERLHIALTSVERRRSRTTHAAGVHARPADDTGGARSGEAGCRAGAKPAAERRRSA
jgi:ATP phosphoribosyltransferase regulatory subunit